MKRILFLAATLFSLFSCAPKGQQNTTESIIPSEYNSLNPQNMQRVRDFLHSTQVYFLATVDGDQPQVRPFGTAEIIEGKLYIQTGHVKNVAKQIAANPKVAICAFNGSEWLRITATLVEDPRVEVKKAMLDAIRDSALCMTRTTATQPSISSRTQRPPSVPSLRSP